MKAYSKEDLEGVTKDKLFQLADYYDLKTKKSMLKDQLIDVIIEYLNRNLPRPTEIRADTEIPEDNEEGLPQMSVRIRRIYEQSQ